jgi:hypothetical protein
MKLQVTKEAELMRTLVISRRRKWRSEGKWVSILVSSIYLNLCHADTTPLLFPAESKKKEKEKEKFKF